MQPSVKLTNEIWQSEQPRVFKALMKRVGDVDLAEELTQRVALRALESIDSFDGRDGATLATWLYTLADRVLSEEIKRQVKERRRRRTLYRPPAPKNRNDREACDEDQDDLDDEDEDEAAEGEDQDEGLPEAQYHGESEVQNWDSGDRSAALDTVFPRSPARRVDAERPPEDPSDPLEVSLALARSERYGAYRIELDPLERSTDEACALSFWDEDALYDVAPAAPVYRNTEEYYGCAPGVVPNAEPARPADSLYEQRELDEVVRDAMAEASEPLRSLATALVRTDTAQAARRQLHLTEHEMRVGFAALRAHLAQAIVAAGYEIPRPRRRKRTAAKRPVRAARARRPRPEPGSAAGRPG